MLGIREILSKSDVMPLGESTNESSSQTVQKKSMGPEWILPTVSTQSVRLFNRAIRFNDILALKYQIQSGLLHYQAWLSLS